MKRLFFVLTIVLFLYVPVTAQEEQVNLIVFVDDFSLTLAILDPGNVSLEDVVIEANDEQFPLSDYQLLLDYSAVNTPICLRLERYVGSGVSKPPLPQACFGVPTAVQTVIAADAFWYDPASSQQTRPVRLRRETEEGLFCPASSGRCEVSLSLEHQTRNTADSTISPAASGEILIVLAQFRQVSGTEREPALVMEEVLDEALTAARARGVNVRIGQTLEVVTTRERAHQIADETGATVVLWGQVDPAGLDTHYEIVERGGQHIETRVEETHFTAQASLDEVDIRIRTAEEQRYVLNFTIGQLLYFDQQFDPALPFFEDALALVETMSAAEQQALAVGKAQFYLGTALSNISVDPNPSARLARAIIAYQAALGFLTLESAPLDYGVTQTNLGNAYAAMATYADWPGNLSDAITAYHEALRAFTPESAPVDYARTQNDLGVTYVDLSEYTDPRANLEYAIIAYQEALRFITSETQPLDYAWTQMNLGNAYALLAGYSDPQGNLFRSIAAYQESLRFSPAEVEPMEYATIQSNMGIAFRRLAGYTDSQVNLEYAVAAFQEALRFRSAEVSPSQYACTQNNLGNAYSDLAGYISPQANLSLAIAAYQEALRFFTAEAAPMDFAMTQANLGNTYAALSRYIDSQANLSLAIAAYQEALRFFTEEAFPRGYALTQNNLGRAYITLANYIDSQANLSLAITAYQEALRFLTAEAAPLDYATTQTNLGSAYRTLGESRDDQALLNAAIAAYQEALKLFTPDVSPLDYAWTQTNLGQTYAALAWIDDEQVYLERAVAAYQEALHFYTPEGSPLDYTHTTRSLGAAYYRQGRTEDACGLWRDATEILGQFGDTASVEVIEGVMEQYCISGTPPTIVLDEHGRAVIGNQSGSLMIGGAEGWTYAGQAGEVVAIFVRAASPANDAEDRTGLLDTLVRVYAPDGSLLAEADDIENGVFTDSELPELVLPASGVYRIEIRSWENRSGGAYTLTIKHPMVSTLQP